MTTLATLREHWLPAFVQCYRDGFTPPNHFIAQTTVERVTRYYLLKGEWGDHEAPVLGHLEIPQGKHSILYKGSDPVGGEYVGQNTGFLGMNRLIESSS